jgi:hypothetical protein
VPPVERPEPVPPPVPAPETTPPVGPAPTPPVEVPTSQPLTAPTLISPSEGQSFPRAYGSTFQWTEVPTATQYEWELQEEGPDGLWRTTQTQIVNGTRYRPERMEKGRFQWHVRAIRGDLEGPWSTWFRLFMY